MPFLSEIHLQKSKTFFPFGYEFFSYCVTGTMITGFRLLTRTCKIQAGDCIISHKGGARRPFLANRVKQ